MGKYNYKTAAYQKDKYAPTIIHYIKILVVRFQLKRILTLQSYYFFFWNIGLTIFDYVRHHSFLSVRMLRKKSVTKDETKIEQLVTSCVKLLYLINSFLYLSVSV